MVARTLELSLADERIYEEVAASKSFTPRLVDQLSRPEEVLHTPLPTAIAVGALVLLALRVCRRGVDWLSVGLMVVAAAFVGFAAEAGVVTSRYYLPAIVLAALVLARSARELGPRVAAATGIALVGLGTIQALDARGWVDDWADVERDRHALVREAAARSAGGCVVDVIGLNVELVQALPVLAPLADEAGRDCRTGERYLVVIDPGGPGTETRPSDPVLSSVRPGAGAGLELGGRQGAPVHDVTLTNCNVCATAFPALGAELFVKDGHSIVHCPRCGLVFRATLPTPEELDELYGSLVLRWHRRPRPAPGTGTSTTSADAELHRVNARRRLARLQRFSAPGSLLDVGCAAGFFVDEASRAGWRARRRRRCRDDGGVGP